MITITRKLAKQLRTVFRRGCLLSRRASPPIHFQSDSSGLRIRVCAADGAIEYYQAGEFESDEIIAPFELLTDCEGGRLEPVQLERDDSNHITVSWHDGAIPQRLRYECPELTREFPNMPEHLAENQPGMLAALHACMETTDPDSSRYALGTTQVQGKRGAIAATDGRHLLRYQGFDFPFDDDVLVPKNTIFGCRELSHDGSVHIGKSDTWITFQNGPWTIHLALQKDGRFPDVDEVVPKHDTVTHQLTITPADAEFLSQSLPRLPENDDFHHPVTVDLNGKVALRGTDNEHTTELILSGSNYQGEPLRWNTNRKYLARAVELGLREISLQSVAGRAICYGDNCEYMWMLLSQDGCIPPDETADRIESNSERTTVPITHPNTRSPRITMTTKATPEKRNGTANVHSQGGESQDIEELIQQAEAVKASLRETTGQVSELIAALKRQRKQNRLVQSTLASLRQLQTIAG